MDAGALVPLAYVLSRNAPPGLVQTALAAFSITPLSCVIISNMKDHPLALEFGALVVRTQDEIHSIEFALESFYRTQMPSLVIGNRDGIRAIYEDGFEENLLWQEADLMPN